MMRTMKQVRETAIKYNKHINKTSIAMWIYRYSWERRLYEKTVKCKHKFVLGNPYCLKCKKSFIDAAMERD